MIKILVPFKKRYILKIFLFLVLVIGLGLKSQPIQAAPLGTVIMDDITTDTVWTEAGSPYLINITTTIQEGATLTIEPGVTIANSTAWNATSYSFIVKGTLLAQGTAEKPIHFEPGQDGWSGINIVGEPTNINTGSVLEHVILNRGGFGASGSGGNLVLSFAEVTVRNCQFNNGPGDGILGDDGGTQGTAHVFDSSFTNNAGYAIDFQDGAVNPVLSNLTASGNGYDDGTGQPLPYGGNMVSLGSSITLHGAHTWENMGLPYLIDQMTVAPDSVLTIEPGVQVLAAPGNDGLLIQGTLIADGTAEKRIRFEPGDTGQGWSGILISGSATNRSTGSLLDHVLISKGGNGSQCSLPIEHGDITVINTIIENGGDSAVCLRAGANLTMSDTRLTGNADHAIDVFEPDARFTLARMTAANNGRDTIGVHAGTMFGSHHFMKSGIDTYDLGGQIIVDNAGALTVDPGVTLRSAYGARLTVHGTLASNGTAVDPVLITTEEKQTAQWAGIEFIGTPEKPAVGTFRYTTIEYGGYGGASMIEVSNGSVNLQFSTLRFAAYDALHFVPDASPSAMQTNTAAVAPSSIVWSRLHAIGGYAINNLSAQEVRAKNNWWGTDKGPTTASNPGGTGSAINGPVAFQPYLKAPVSQIVFLPLLTR